MADTDKKRRSLKNDETRLVSFDEMTPTEKTTWYAERASEARELDDKAKASKRTQDVNNAIYKAKRFQSDIGLLPKTMVGDPSTFSDDYKKQASEKRREEPKPNSKYGMDIPRNIKPYAKGGSVRGDGCAQRGKTKGRML
jgi:hypothetical protein